MRLILISIFLFLTPNQLYALTPKDDALFVRVIDTGSGLATAVQMPGKHYMLFDAGHWTGKKCCIFYK